MEIQISSSTWGRCVHDSDILELIACGHQNRTAGALQARSEFQEFLDFSPKLSAIIAQRVRF